jgi:hypothetical protein
MICPCFFFFFLLIIGQGDYAGECKIMESKQEYIINCWHCGAVYDAIEANFCNHDDPTKTCPFCLQCFCDAPINIRNQFIRNSPKELLEEKIRFQEGADDKLGELLIKRGKITELQLSNAIQKQAIEKKQLGEILIEMNLVTENELRVFLSDQKEFDEFDFSKFLLNYDLIDELGRQFCLGYQFIPLELVEDNDEKIFRFVVSSKEDFKRLKASPRLEGHVLIPYLGDQETIHQLLREIRDGDVLVLE